MNCKEVENKLIFYIENKTDVNSAEKIKAHLKICSSCNALYENIKADMIFLSNDKILQEDALFYQKLVQKINDLESKISTNNIKQFYIQALSYAAAIIIAVFIGIALGKDNQITEQIAMDENEQLSEFQLFANSYTMDINADDTYELIISDNNNNK